MLSSSAILTNPIHASVHHSQKTEPYEALKEKLLCPDSDWAVPCLCLPPICSHGEIRCSECFCITEGRMPFHMRVFVEFERAIISERVRAGLERVGQNGL